MGFFQQFGILVEENPGDLTKQLSVSTDKTQGFRKIEHGAVSR